MIPSPQRLGLPERFSAWRRAQERAIGDLTLSDTLIDGICMPTGGGKTALAIGYAQLLGPDARIVYLTATRALQSQIAGEMAAMGLRSVSGKANYRCNAATSTEHVVSVEAGPCWSGASCELVDSGCEWFEALGEAQGARLVVTNYDKWISTPDIEAELGRFDVLVADEAHQAPEKLSEHLRVQFRRDEVESTLRLRWPGDADRVPLEVWREWARRERGTVDAALRVVEKQLKEAFGGRGWGSPGASSGGAGGAGGEQRVRGLAYRAKQLRAAALKMQQLRTLGGEWVLDTLSAVTGNRRDDGVSVDPVWPAGYAAERLWRGVERRVLMSATFVPKIFDVLGVERGTATFREYPSDFPVSHRPVYAVVSSPPLRLNARTESDESTMQRIAETVDTIIGLWLDAGIAPVRTIVHTGSYRRAEALLARSRYRELMISHRQGDRTALAAAVERYLRAEPPTVLVSPALEEGWDFADDACRCQIVLKMPFADLRTRVMQARTSSDPSYADWLVARKLTQIAGRPVRSRSDRAATYIVDGHAQWWPFARGHRELFPRYFMDAYRVVRLSELPSPRALFAGVLSDTS